MKRALFSLASIFIGITLLGCGTAEEDFSSYEFLADSVGLYKTVRIIKMAYIHKESGAFKINICTVTDKGCTDIAEIASFGSSKEPMSVVLMPAGDEVVYIRKTSGFPQIFRKKSGGDEVKITKSDKNKAYLSFFAPEDLLYFSAADWDSEYELYHMVMEDGSKPVRDFGADNDVIMASRHGDSTQGPKFVYLERWYSGDEYSKLRERQPDGRVLKGKFDVSYHTSPIYIAPASNEIYFVGGRKSKHGIYKTVSGDLSKADKVYSEDNMVFSYLASHPDGDKIVFTKRQRGNDGKNPANIIMCDLIFSSCKALTGDGGRGTVNFSASLVAVEKEMGGGGDDDDDDNNDDDNGGNNSGGDNGGNGDDNNMNNNTTPTTGSGPQPMLIAGGKNKNGGCSAGADGTQWFAAVMMMLIYMRKRRFSL